MEESGIGGPDVRHSSESVALQGSIFQARAQENLRQMAYINKDMYVYIYIYIHMCVCMYIYICITNPINPKPNWYE